MSDPSPFDAELFHDSGETDWQPIAVNHERDICIMQGLGEIPAHGDPYTIILLRDPGTGNVVTRRLPGTWTLENINEALRRQS